MDSGLKHDFINNCLRIEILNKLISEKLEQKVIPNKEQIEDLKRFLTEHLTYLEQM